jgi:hypothetical protein
MQVRTAACNYCARSEEVSGVQAGRRVGESINRTEPADKKMIHGDPL